MTATPTQHPKAETTLAAQHWHSESSIHFAVIALEMQESIYTGEPPAMRKLTSRTHSNLKVEAINFKAIAHNNFYVVDKARELAQLMLVICK